MCAISAPLFAFFGRFLLVKVADRVYKPDARDKSGRSERNCNKSISNGSEYSSIASMISRPLIRLGLTVKAGTTYGLVANSFTKRISNAGLSSQAGQWIMYLETL
jgi:hypothetical protein